MKRNDLLNFVYLSLLAVLGWLVYTFFKKGGVASTVGDGLTHAGENIGSVIADSTESISDFFKDESQTSSYKSKLNTIRSQYFKNMSGPRRLKNESAKNRANSLHQILTGVYFDDKDQINELTYTPDGWEADKKYLVYQERDKLKLQFSRMLLSKGDVYAIAYYFGLDGSHRTLFEKLATYEPEIYELLKISTEKELGYGSKNLFQAYYKRYGKDLFKMNVYLKKD